MERSTELAGPWRYDWPMAPDPRSRRKTSRAPATPPDVKVNSDEFERTREAIVRAAADVFRRDGFRAGTTKDIAAMVGLSQPSLYYYVGSKETLLAELALRLDQQCLLRTDVVVQRRLTEPHHGRDVFRGAGQIGRASCRERV